MERIGRSGIMFRLDRRRAQKFDDESYTIRFTPRRERSTWSAINIAKVAELKKNGLMRPAGIAAFAKREESNSAIYAYENNSELTAELERAFKKNTRAWNFFQEQAAWYRRMCIHQVASAKKDETRWKRLKKLIEASASRKRI